MSSGNVRFLGNLTNVKEDDYNSLAQAVIGIARKGDFISLKGDLGSGKTSFARELIRLVLQDTDVDVPSPTYNLVQTYCTTNTTLGDIWHFDLYRLEDPEELIEIGIEEAEDTGVSIVEWPDKGGHYMPKSTLTISFEPGDTDGCRTLSLSGDERWDTLGQKLPKMRSA